MATKAKARKQRQESQELRRERDALVQKMATYPEGGAIHRHLAEKLAELDRKLKSST